MGWVTCFEQRAIVARSCHSIPALHSRILFLLRRKQISPKRLLGLTRSSRVLQGASSGFCFTRCILRYLHGREAPAMRDDPWCDPGRAISGSEKATPI